MKNQGIIKPKGISVDNSPRGLTKEVAKQTNMGDRGIYFSQSRYRHTSLKRAKGKIEINQ